MSRYSLRTLLILLAVGPPLVAFGYWRWSDYRAAQERKRTARISGTVVPQVEEPARISLHDVLYESHPNP
jgi:hypothetical protein